MQRILLLCLISVSVSCSKFTRIRNSRVWQEKYEAALTYYEKKEYAKASLLLEELMPLLRGAPEGETAMFYYAYALYYQRSYILSAEYFHLFAKTYPRSTHAEEASYMHAYTQYLNTEPFYYDQAPTYEALRALQAFIESYPESQKRSKCQAIIDELQHRLAEKAFYSAKLYYGIGYLKAATLAFQDFQKTFPTSPHLEESWYLLILASYNLSVKSITNKQLERYQETQKIYERFIDKFPKSAYLAELEPLYKKSLEVVRVLSKKVSLHILKKENTLK